MKKRTKCKDCESTGNWAGDRECQKKTFKRHAQYVVMQGKDAQQMIKELEEAKQARIVSSERYEENEKDRTEYYQLSEGENDRMIEEVKCLIRLLHQQHREHAR